MEKLKQRVKELLQRVDQLTDLLRRANIMVPPLVPCPDKQESLSLTQKWMNQRPRKWTEKVNVVVPDEKIENIISLIKNFRKKNLKVNSCKKTCKSYEKSSDNKGTNGPVVKKATFSERLELKKKKQLKKIKTPKIPKVTDVNCDKSDKNGSETFTESQSPSHTKENQPVDFNLPSAENIEGSDVLNKGDKRTDKVDSENKTFTKTTVSDKISIVTGKVKNLIEPQNNVFLPASANVMQSNTFLLTNDGNLVQFPILNSSGNVFGTNANLTAIVNQPNSGLLTPLVINRPSPVIVLQKPAPQIIQTAQIVNPSPQILSVPNQNIQILSNSIVCGASSQNSKMLPYILSKQPPNKKRITKDSTMTTFVNKIPIPALSKQSYAKKSGSLNCGKGKNITKSKDGKEKEKSNEIEVEIQASEKEIQTDKEPGEEDPGEKEKEKDDGSTQKRVAEEDDVSQSKKQKISEAVDNVFKPIENPIVSDPPVPSDGLFCNLKLPTSIGHNLSVSPTAAFLSTFPIVASSKFEEELTAKIDERRPDAKDGKHEDKSKEKEMNPESELPNSKECVPEVSNVPVVEKESAAVELQQGPELQKTNCDMNIVSGNMNAELGGGGSNTNKDENISTNALGQCPQLKSWDEYQPAKNCEVRSDPFYIQSDVQVPPPMTDLPVTTYPDANPVYKNPYPQPAMKNFAQNNVADQMTLKNNQFDYSQKDNYGVKRMNYNSDRNVVKKSCTNVINDPYVPKNQTPMYQSEPAPNYQLVSVKEMNNQRNMRPPVNWMTDPDIRVRSMNYGTAKIPPYTQPDIFYNNQNKPQTDVSDCVLTDVNKLNYQKEFYGNKTAENQMKVPDQRCKNLEKRPDPKFSNKPPLQNTYNIFDYNYNGNYFGEDEGKFCNVQNYQSTVVKNNKKAVAKKKSDGMHLIDQQTNEPSKRNSDQIIGNFDFNHVSNQECFSWVPGKNLEWLPSKSFVDTNLILPSTLPTLVGDLALGTTTSDVAQTKGNRQKPDASSKSYIDIGLGNFPKDAITENGNKQYLEPFANLSKNIFDTTPSNTNQNLQLAKNDCEKNAYANETIVLKNIFELPVSKSFSNDFQNRSKQRPVNNTQNNFLSVSQLVETANYDSNNIKSEGSLENGTQNYNYHGNQKSYKNKNRNSHYKYNDRKYQSYKNTSTNYTAEALIRSNPNLSYQSNDFQPEANANFYKNQQKADSFPASNETAQKTDFVPCTTQNIYTDFNFSSPVPNFNITSSVNADYVTHEGNFSAQNNSFFGDFVPPEYPISESVSNSLLLPPCSIGLQNPFIIEKRNGTPEKANKPQGKQYSNSRSRKNFDCSKTNYDFPIGHNTSAGIFTTASITCPTIFTTTSCQNLLPVPNQNIPDANITFPASSFNNITFPPPLTSNANGNYHRSGAGQNATTASFFPSSCHSMFTTCSTTTVSSSRTCLSTIPPTSSSGAVIMTPFSVGNAPFPPATQSIPFLSLSNPIIPPSVPSTSGNTLANFNLSTIFPEINQKGNYHYP